VGDAPLRPGREPFETTFIRINRAPFLLKQVQDGDPDWAERGGHRPGHRSSQSVADGGQVGSGNRVSSTGGVLKPIGSPTVTTDQNPCLRGLFVLTKAAPTGWRSARAKGMNSMSANRPAPGPLQTPGHPGAYREAYQKATPATGRVRHCERVVDHSPIQAAHPTRPEKTGVGCRAKAPGTKYRGTAVIAGVANSRYGGAEPVQSLS
jgi:hypothetical protein